MAAHAYLLREIELYAVTATQEQVLVKDNGDVGLRLPISKTDTGMAAPSHTSSVDAIAFLSVFLKIKQICYYHPWRAQGTGLRCEGILRPLFGARI